MKDSEHEGSPWLIYINISPCTSGNMYDVLSNRTPPLYFGGQLWAAKSVLFQEAANFLRTMNDD